MTAAGGGVPTGGAPTTGSTSGASTTGGGAAGPRYGFTPTGVQYGPLEADDALRCAELDAVLFAADGAWSAPTFLSQISSRHNTCFGARLGGELVGYAVLASLGPAGDREFEVQTIGVAPGKHRLGIGRTMLRQMLDVADREGADVVLDVRTDNLAARTLYEAHGFEIVGLRPRYYRPSMADAYLMKRPGRAPGAGASGAGTSGAGTSGAGASGAGASGAGHGSGGAAAREDKGEVGGS